MTRYRIGLLHLIKLVLEKSVVILGISIPDKM
jgi:arginyl-tRNA synthetase